MRIPKYLINQLKEQGCEDIISRYNLLNANAGEIINCIIQLESKVNQEEGHADNAERNYQRIALSLKKQEDYLTNKYKEKLFASKPSIDFLCNKLHGNLNSRVYHKYEGFETDLTFWEWVELRDYVTYDELLADYWQLIEYRVRYKIRDGEVNNLIDINCFSL